MAIGLALIALLAAVAVLMIGMVIDMHEEMGAVISSPDKK